eukprot:11194598-Lingulodinium_polyedra.AAC.1
MAVVVSHQEAGVRLRFNRDMNMELCNKMAGEAMNVAKGLLHFGSSGWAFMKYQGEGMSSFT